MKKKLIAILLTAAMSLSLAACGGNSDGANESKDGETTEYNIEEFGEMYEETESLFDEESKYLTDEELYGNKGYEVYEKCSEKTGLPFNEPITLRGKKANSIVGFCVESDDGEYSIACFFNDDIPNTSLFINEGENIIVHGIFSEKANSRGCLTNVAIDSPEDIDIAYESNVTEVLANYENMHGAIIVQGEIDTVVTLDEFETFMGVYGDTVNYEHQDYYYDTVASLNGEDGCIYFMYSKDQFGELEVGDKIAVQGYIYDLMSLKTADGTSRVCWGLMNNIYDIYIFK